MSCVLVISPVLTAAWSALAPSLRSVASTMGWTLDPKPNKSAQSHSVELTLNDSTIVGNSAAREQLVIRRDGCRGIFTRQARGALSLCMDGNHKSRRELQKIGDELLDRVQQQFIRDRLVTELHRRHLTIVEEQTSPNGTIKIRVRNNP